MIGILKEMRAEMQSISRRLTTLENSREAPEETESLVNPLPRNTTQSSTCWGLPVGLTTWTVWRCQCTRTLVSWARTKTRRTHKELNCSRSLITLRPSLSHTSQREWTTTLVNDARNMERLDCPLQPAQNWTRL